MKFETRFDEGDEIFFINNSKKISSTICRGFRLEYLNGKQSFTYLCNNEAEPSNVNIKIDAEEAFASKKELLASL